MPEHQFLSIAIVCLMARQRVVSSCQDSHSDIKAPQVLVAYEPFAAL